MSFRMPGSLVHLQSLGFLTLPHLALTICADARPYSPYCMTRLPARADMDCVICCLPVPLLEDRSASIAFNSLSPSSLVFSVLASEGYVQEMYKKWELCAVLVTCAVPVPQQNLVTVTSVFEGQALFTILGGCLIYCGVYPKFQKESSILLHIKVLAANTSTHRKQAHGPCHHAGCKSVFMDAWQTVQDKSGRRGHN